jgi:hypothetical protein
MPEITPPPINPDHSVDVSKVIVETPFERFLREQKLKNAPSFKKTF